MHVVEDEAGFRMAIADLIETIGFRANPFHDGCDFLDALDGCVPGLILLDIQMPHRSGFEVMAELSQRACDWPIIAMTAYGDIPMAVQAMRLGAYDFVQKPITPDRLKHLLPRALDDWATRETVRSSEEVARRQIRALTPREHDVLMALSAGKQNKSVAFDLGLSVRTVEMHRAKMLARLSVKSVQEAVALLALSSIRSCANS
ncbi:response regulator [Sphingomonas sp. CFBP8993]|uniref:response regulator transcription factor n=1 Tax=Sphingomonas sp. CFBP8993 TaxID=3096526 RepID=UPI002A6ABE06|nr:response regulator [Sphingomonas sp. CFBP8993]MDY0959460.1 response regulator [Sphingomonas sp. CFBP8993]